MSRGITRSFEYIKKKIPITLLLNNYNRGVYIKEKRGGILKTNINERQYPRLDGMGVGGE